jgi:hypothetical protein
MKKGGRLAASQGLQCEGNLVWFPEFLDRNAWQTPVRYGGETKRTSSQLGRSGNDSREYGRPAWRQDGVQLCLRGRSHTHPRQIEESVR